MHSLMPQYHSLVCFIYAILAMSEYEGNERLQLVNSRGIVLLVLVGLYR